MHESAKLTVLRGKVSDFAFSEFINRINRTYKDMLTETEVCEILGFHKTYFYRLRKKEALIPFIQIGNRVSYLKQDVIDFLKKNRRA